MEPSTPSRSRPKKALIAILFAVLAIAAGSYVVFGARKPAPEVTYTTIKGEKVTSASLRGKVVMVNFWATSCTTCVKEMPQMVETYQKYNAKGLEFVAVAMAYDPPNYVVNFTETRALPFKVALDLDGSLAEAYGKVTLTPTTFVIDKQGKIIKRYVGEPDFAQLHQLLEKELAA
ncbi:MAG TPA: TlpA disulfide reductase family protein [Burkholderiaceae bacterium]